VAIDLAEKPVIQLVKDAADRLKGLRPQSVFHHRIKSSTYTCRFVIDNPAGKGLLDLLNSHSSSEGGTHPAFGRLLSSHRSPNCLSDGDMRSKGDLRKGRITPFFSSARVIVLESILRLN
jgi:hypothetical protein